jgi:hypothetical protein
LTATRLSITLLGLLPSRRTKMMKQGWVGFLGFLLAGIVLPAQEPGRASSNIELGGGKVAVQYGTPRLGDRSLDDMIKPGLAWRMGMNNPTTLETAVALDFGGKKLNAGKYSLFARPDENKNWTLIISSAMRSMLDPSTVVLETPLEFKKSEDSEDLLKITLSKSGDDASLLVAWGNYRLRRTFKAAP